MSTGTAGKLRVILRSSAYSDGLTIYALAPMLGISIKAVGNSLRGMPDVYVDRWVPNRDASAPGRRHVAVWCAVAPPPNCPYPTKEQL